MSSYNERLADINARLEAIAERVNALPGGTTYETCTLEIIYDDGLINEITCCCVENGSVVTKTVDVGGSIMVTVDNVLCGSIVFGICKKVGLSPEGCYPANDGDGETLSFLSSNVSKIYHFAVRVRTENHNDEPCVFDIC